MSHYVCKSCGGVSETPKTCETDGCKNNGHDLVECNCVNPESHKKTENKETEDQTSEE